MCFVEALGRAMRACANKFVNESRATTWVAVARLQIRTLGAADHVHLVNRDLVVIKVALIDRRQWLHSRTLSPMRNIHHVDRHGFLMNRVVGLISVSFATTQPNSDITNKNAKMIVDKFTI